MSEPIARNPGRKRKVLVYLFGSLGDSIVAIPALRAVRRHFSDAEIVMLQNFASGNIVLASQVVPDGLVDRYLSYESRPGEARRLIEFYRLWRRLLSERFDSAVYLITSERTTKAVSRDRLFFRSCGIRKLYGFHAVPVGELYPLEPNGGAARSDHEAVFKLKRLERDGIEYSGGSDLRTPLIEPSAAEIVEVGRWIAERRRNPTLPLVSIGPGCKQQVNEWPTENFIRLGRKLLTERPCEIVVVGGKGEFEMGEKLVSAWGSGINVAGVCSVRQSAALLSQCSFHIGLDTGTTHLAAAVGTRCFAIFGGRNNPGMWYPLGRGHTVIEHNVPCAPCRSFTCPVLGHPCMTDISFAAVWSYLIDFIDRDGSYDVEAVAA